MLTKSESKKRHRRAVQRPTTEQWEIIATLGFAIIIGVICYSVFGPTKANAAVTTSRASVSSRPSASYSSSRSYSSTSTRSASSFKSTPARPTAKPSTIRSVKPVSSAKPLPVTSTTQKKKKKSGFEYEYYAFTDCIPYSGANFQGWKCIDRY